MICLTALTSVKTRASTLCRCGRSRCEAAVDQGVKTRTTKVCRRVRSRGDDAGEQGLKMLVIKV